MTALATAVEARYPAQVLNELTNPRDSTATSFNSTKLEQAVTSVQVYFATHAQEDYDSTVGIHVEVAVRGVIALLQSWGGSAQGVARIKWDAWLEEVKAVRNTRARARLEPATNSELTPSDEVDGTQEVRPFADRQRYRRLLPEQGTRGADEHDFDD